MMKKLLYGLVCCCSLAYGQNQDTSDVLMLNDDWSFSQVGTEKWLPATVPGTVHQDLIHHKLLPDPFYGTNEKKIQWVEDEDWEYKTCFVVTEEQLKRDAAQLFFEGLDTYADVYLNGSLVLKSDNMFVGYAVPVKQVLRKGENLLHVYFHSPIKQTLHNGHLMDLIIRLIMIITKSVLVYLLEKHLIVMDGTGESAWLQAVSGVL